MLIVDADDVVLGDAARFRGWLSNVEEHRVAVTVRTPPAEGGAGEEHAAGKVFRRTGARWVGRGGERVAHPGLDEDATVRLVPAEMLIL